MADDNDATVAATFEGSITPTGTLKNRVGLRSYFSTHFLASAEDAVEHAKHFEEHVSGHEPRFSLAHRGDVVSAIILSAAFIEAAINEVLQDVAVGHESEKIAGVSDDVRKRWAGLWEALDRGLVGRILDRYQAALISAGAVPFNKGEEPWQSASLLVSMRNHLVHYKPETVFADEPEKLVLQLRGKVEQNPLSTNEGEVDGWLSSDCARWALTTALAFVEEFAAKTGTRPNYQLVLEDLRAKNP